MTGYITGIHPDDEEPVTFLIAVRTAIDRQQQYALVIVPPSANGDDSAGVVVHYSHQEPMADALTRAPYGTAFPRWWPETGGLAKEIIEEWEGETVARFRGPRTEEDE